MTARAEWVWEPDEDLAPDTEYSVVGDGEWSFRTASGPDDSPPAAPVVEGVDDWHPVVPGCGRHPMYTFTLSGEGALLVVDTSGSIAEEVPFTGAADVAEFDRPYTLHEWGGGTAEVRFALADLAGNLSEWSEPMEVRACGCRSGSGGALPPVAALALARRRRRRT